LKKILVTGAGGLSSKLIHSLSKGYEVTRTHNTKPYDPDSLRMDITDITSVMKVFNMANPDVTVHAAAMTDVDKCETNRELAWSINVLGTKNVAERCKENGTKLIYISTDYVFEGAKGLYKEDDETNPINYYGFTKLKCEEFVRDLCKDFIIARTSGTNTSPQWLYGDTERLECGIESGQIVVDTIGCR
jgi:dTDP-4-dehydrorhamnose reductase